MGASCGAICNKCGHHYVIRDGGGFIFELLHCDKCGTEKSVSLKDLFRGSPETLEAKLYRCTCGGLFKINAPHRCPKCKSTTHKVDPDMPTCLYD